MTPSRPLPRDPYRLFFPLGILLGIKGVVIWPLYYFGFLTGYWGLSHAFLQSNGFLFCFIAGFLLTAVPRFTGTTVPTRAAQWSLATLVIIGALSLASPNDPRFAGIAASCFSAAYLLLLVFVGQRFLARKTMPPSFPLMGLGLVSGTIGAMACAFATFGVLPPDFLLFGKRSLTEGMTLLLVLGVGGFLGPRLLGFERITVVQIDGVARPASPANRSWENLRAASRSPQVLAAVTGLIVWISVVSEYLLGWAGMSLVRAIAATAFMFYTLEPWRAPLDRSTLSWCVWSANLLTIVGLWLVALFPKYTVDFLHVLFIGGFTLLILGVGMRVTLSHGGHGTAQEKKNWPLRIAVSLGLIAMLARVGAPFSPTSYSAHLTWAAILWLAGLGIWGWRLIRLILR